MFQLLLHIIEQVVKLSNHIFLEGQRKHDFDGKSLWDS